MLDVEAAKIALPFRKGMEGAHGFDLVVRNSNIGTYCDWRKKNDDRGGFGEGSERVRTSNPAETLTFSTVRNLRTLFVKSSIWNRNIYKLYRTAKYIIINVASHI